MDREQEEQYGEIVARWKESVKAYGTGWDEDGPEIPVDYPLDVDMVRYMVGGTFQVFDGEQLHLIVNPECDILARVRKVKAHMNRMISALHFAEQELSGGEAVVDLFAFARRATENLAAAHHGSRYRVLVRTRLAQALAAHCTGLPSTLPWEFAAGYEFGHPQDETAHPEGLPEGADVRDLWKGWVGHYLTHLRTTVFTVCPFVLHETGGKQSHTQRTHVEIELTTTAPVVLSPIMREVTGRLVPVMSNMKIPDEVVQVLKSYSGPTFTEDGAVRVQKILRGITAEFVPEGEVVWCKVRVISEDSHLAHDIETTLENDLA